MAQPFADYRQVVIETYSATKSGKASKIHARPVAGEFYPPTMDVECSRDMRKRHTVGTKFRVYAKETNREDGKPFLYTYHGWPYEVIE